MKSAVIAAALATLAPIAHAQLSCDEIDELMDLAWNDFDDIVADEAGDDVYHTDYYLTGAEQCYVGYGDAAMHACLWTAGSENEGQELFEHFADTLDVCLSSWDRTNDNPASGDPTLVALRSLTFMGDGDEADFEWIVTLDRHDEDGAVDWHVSVGVSLYYW